MLACLSGTENLGHVKPSLNTGNPTVLRGIRGKGPKGWLAAETEREGRRKTDATVRSVAMAKLQSQAEMTWPLKQAA